jgi:RNA polymerase-binding transcription factor DksA
LPHRTRIPAEVEAILPELKRELLRQRAEILAENQRLEAEFTAALDSDVPLLATDVRDQVGISLRVDDWLDRFRTVRLDAIDRALEAMAAGYYGICGGCGTALEASRLRTAPETHLCPACARAPAESSV